MMKLCVLSSSSLHQYTPVNWPFLFTETYFYTYSGDYEEYYFEGDVTLCILAEVHRRFGVKYRLNLHDWKQSSAYSLFLAWVTVRTLKNEAVCFSETSVDFHISTRYWVIFLIKFITGYR
jgi:hypothetical protein